MPRTKPSQTFDLIGRDEELEAVRLQITGALRLKKPIPDMLFEGPSGVGKTLFVQTAIKLCGLDVELHKIPVKPSRQQFRQVFFRLQPFDIVYADEGHLLGSVKGVQYDLMQALDDGKLVVTENDVDVDPTKLNDDGTVSIPPFTLILATNEPGRLLPALTSRIQCRIYLPRYEDDQMRRIIPAIAGRHEPHLVLSNSTITELVVISHGIPRAAEMHIDGLANHISALGTWHPDETIGVNFLRDYLKCWHIDNLGFGPREREHLRCLAKQGPVAGRRLAQLLKTDLNTMEEYETELIDQGLVVVQSGGHRLTAAGREHLESYDQDSDAKPKRQRRRSRANSPPN